MKIKNNIWVGLALGLLLPGIAFISVEILKKQIVVLQKQDLLYIGCVALNLLVVRYATKKNKDLISRGVIAATFICAMVFFFYKVR